MFVWFSPNLLRSVVEEVPGANDNSSFCLEELVQTDPFQCLTIPKVGKPFQGLIYFPLGGFKALSLSGGWKNSCEPFTIQAFVSIPPLPTLPPV